MAEGFQRSLGRNFSGGSAGAVHAAERNFSVYVRLRTDDLIPGKFERVVAINGNGVDVELGVFGGKIKYRCRCCLSADDEPIPVGIFGRIRSGAGILSGCRDDGACAERHSVSANPNFLRSRIAELERTGRFARIEIDFDFAVVFRGDLAVSVVGKSLNRHGSADQGPTVNGKPVAGVSNGKLRLRRACFSRG